MTDIKLFNHVSVSRHKPALFGWSIGFGNQCNLLFAWSSSIWVDLSYWCMFTRNCNYMFKRETVCFSQFGHHGASWEKVKCRNRFLKPFWLLPVIFSYNKKLIMWILSVCLHFTVWYWCLSFSLLTFKNILTSVFHSLLKVESCLTKVSSLTGLLMFNTHYVTL